MKARIFITTGDELLLSNMCDKFDCKLQIGGHPDEHDLTLDGFERDEEMISSSKGSGRWDWMVVYIISDSMGKLFGIRSHFNHSING